MELYHLLFFLLFGATVGVTLASMNPASVWQDHEADIGYEKARAIFHDDPGAYLEGDDGLGWWIGSDSSDINYDISNETAHRLRKEFPND